MVEDCSPDPWEVRGLQRFPTLRLLFPGTTHAFWRLPLCCRPPLAVRAKYYEILGNVGPRQLQDATAGPATGPGCFPGSPPRTPSPAAIPHDSMLIVTDDGSIESSIAKELYLAGSYAAALRYYEQALTVFKHPRATSGRAYPAMTKGSLVVVDSGDGKPCKRATVASLHVDTADVVFTDSATKSPPVAQHSIPYARLMLLGDGSALVTSVRGLREPTAGNKSALRAQVAVLLNAARCALKLQQGATATAHCDAAALAASALKEPHQMMLPLLFLRAKGRLLQEIYEVRCGCCPLPAAVATAVALLGGVYLASSSRLCLCFCVHCVAMTALRAAEVTRKPHWLLAPTATK